MLNSLVIKDEAHRLAPREKTENEDLERVKKLLIDAVRTTGSVTTTDVTEKQPSKSVTVTLNVPAHKPVAVAVI